MHTYLSSDLCWQFIMHNLKKVCFITHYQVSQGRDAPTIKMPTYLLSLQYSVLICMVMLTWSGIKKLRSGGVVKHNSKKDVARFWKWQYFWTISTPVFYGVEKKSKKRLRRRNCRKKCNKKEVTLAKEKMPDWAGTADSTASADWCCFFLLHKKYSSSFAGRSICSHVRQSISALSEASSIWTCADCVVVETDIIQIWCATVQSLALFCLPEKLPVSCFNCKRGFRDEAFCKPAEVISRIRKRILIFGFCGY